MNVEQEQPRRYYAAFFFAVAIVAIILLLFVFIYGKLKLADSERRARDANDQTRLAVLVAVDPCAYLVERVGADRVRVDVLTPKGKSPEDFAPTPAQLAKLTAVKLFLAVGLPIEERFIEKITDLAPEATVVDLMQGLEPLVDECGHDDESIDPHLWTCPAAARHMVERIADALVALDPAGESSYRANAAALDAELAALQTAIAERLAPFHGRAFIVFHPAYGYFAREFHLEQRAIEVDGKAPRPKELEDLVQYARASGVRALIVQPEFNRSSAQTVADKIGAELVVHSPLEKDYFLNLTALVDAVEHSLRQE